MGTPRISRLVEPAKMQIGDHVQAAKPDITGTAWVSRRSRSYMWASTNQSLKKMRRVGWARRANSKEPNYFLFADNALRATIKQRTFSTAKLLRRHGKC
jgi:hypothetical protein